MSANSKLVCIIDDELEITILFREALKTIGGITIFTFTDSILALEHFQVNEDGYVLVISDFKMPGLNGIEFIKKIKKLKRSVRTILMTAFEIDDEIFREYTKKNIIDAFLQKPIRIRDLVKEVETQLHNYETQKKFQP